MDFFNVSTSARPFSNSTVAEEEVVTEGGNADNVKKIVYMAFYSPMGQFLPLIVLRIVISVVGLIGNILVIRTFLKIGLTDTVSIVLFNIGVSDLSLVNTITAMSVVQCLDFAPSDMMRTFKVHPYSIEVLIADFIQDVFVRFSIYSTTFVAAQRCLCVLKPLHFQGMFTRTRTIMAMAAFWVFSLAIPLLGIQYREIITSKYYNNWLELVYSPLKKWSTLMRYSNILFGVLHGICQCVVVLCIFLLIRELKRSVKFRKSISNATSTSSSKEGQKSETGEKTDDTGSKEKRVTIQVSLVAVIFILTNFHRLIFEVFYAIPFIHDYFKANFNNYVLYIYIYELIYLVNASVNFFIYYQYNTRFRQACFKR